MNLREPSIDFAGLATSFGMRAEKIVDPAQFEAIFKDAVNFDAPCLLEIMLPAWPLKLPTPTPAHQAVFRISNAILSVLVFLISDVTDRQKNHRSPKPSPPIWDLGEKEIAENCRPNQFCEIGRKYN